MKTTITYSICIFLAVMFFGTADVVAQKGCDNLFADLDRGLLKGVKPTMTMKQVKKKLPCFTGETSESDGYNCGGGVFYLDHDFFCYTGRDYIEVRGKFKGRMSAPVLGKTVEELLELLGEPDMKVDGYNKKDIWLYRKPYGTLRITFDGDGISSKLGMHSVAPENVELCL